MASSTFRQQDLCSTNITTMAGSENQRLEDASDVGNFGKLIVQVRKPVAGAGPSTFRLYLQHAAVMEEDAFTNITGSYFDLMATGNEVIVFEDTLRFVRWRAETTGAMSPTTQPQFIMDIVARER